MGKVLIWFVIIISTVVLYCLMIMKDKAESDELYEELMRKLILKGGDLQVLWFNTEDMKKVEKMAKKYGILYGQMMRVIRSTQCRRKILKFLNRRQMPKEEKSAYIKCQSRRNQSALQKKSWRATCSKKARIQEKPENG